MNPIYVTKIIEEDFKKGISAKTGKEWSLSKYEASNGVEFNAFGRLEIGDVVQLEKNDYGWSGSKPRKQDIQHEEVIKALKATYAKLLEIERLVKREP